MPLHRLFASRARDARPLKRRIIESLLGRERVHRNMVVSIVRKGERKDRFCVSESAVIHESAELYSLKKEEALLALQSATQSGHIAAVQYFQGNTEEQMYYFPYQPQLRPKGSAVHGDR